MIGALLRYSAGAAAAIALYFSLAAYKNLSEKLASSGEDLLPSGGFSDSKQSAIKESEESKADGEDIDESGDNGGETQITSSDNTQKKPPTLEEYLSRLRCTGCSKRCVLTNPHCSKEEAKAATAETKYYEIYGE